MPSPQRPHDDYIRADGPRWAALTTEVSTVKSLASDALGASIRVERMIRGYWDEESNREVPGIWSDVSTTKTKVEHNNRLFGILVAGIWTVALVFAAQLIGTVFSFWHSGPIGVPMVSPVTQPYNRAP